MLAATRADIQYGADFALLPTQRTCGCEPEHPNCLSRQEILELGSAVINVKRRYRWQKQYPARFIPQVPEKFFKLFSHGETVLDPFLRFWHNEHGCSAVRAFVCKCLRAKQGGMIKCW